MKKLLIREELLKNIKPKVAIIIINWNGWQDTIECLESLFMISYPNYVILIIDNNSNDGSIDKIKMYCAGEIKAHSKIPRCNSHHVPIDLIVCQEDELNESKIQIEKWNFKNKLILIKNKENYGFVVGNNIGIDYSITRLGIDYILLLNNDTIVDKHFLNALVDAAENSDDIGVVGPSIYHYDNANKIILAGGEINFRTGLWNNSKIKEISSSKCPSEVDCIEGSCFLIKRITIETVGAMDPIFVAYWEDLDWCIRIKKAGYKIIYSPNAKIWHKVSASSNKTTGYREYFTTRNRFLIMKKYANKKEIASFLAFFFLINFWLKSLLILLYLKEPKILTCYYKAVWQGLRILKKEIK